MSRIFATPFFLACHHLWPGRPAAGLARTLGRSKATCRSWLEGLRGTPPEVMDALAAVLRGHAAQSLALAESLNREADRAKAKPWKARGWQVVKERDGPGSWPRDARNRMGRPRKEGEEQSFRKW